MLSATRHVLPAPAHSPSESTSAPASASILDDTRPAGIAAPAEPRKRKRGADAPGGFTQKTITVRPCPGSPYDKPVGLAPVTLIGRAQLPLSFLDLGAATSALPSTRLFAAYVEVLEPEEARDDGQGNAAPGVLIARLEADKTFYAVERVRCGVYALCRLGSWVKENDIRAISKAGGREPYTGPLPRVKNEDADNWWQGAALPVPKEVTIGGREGHVPRVLMRRPAAVPQAGSQSQLEKDPFVESKLRPSASDRLPFDPLGAQQKRPQTADEVFQAIVHQYLEALYLSKTSLAFFAKGPMSRARAAFTSKDDASMQMGDLAAFLRSVLLQLGPMDKKYREKLPEIAKSLPLAGLSDDEDAAAARPEKRAKKSKSKKLKPNKEGLYPGEDDYVKKWWSKDAPGSPNGHSGESAEVTLKRRLGDLRVRESMAQVVLVLEIMAIEASPSLPVTDQETAQQDETHTEAQAVPAKKRKPKKPQDLNVLLDLLLDKLCIWQSVEQDETLDKLSKSTNDGGKGITDSNSTQAGISDKLKGFCIEVIIPFYMSRLPEKAAAINKRLGGPSAASPTKPSNTGSTSSRSKPGEAAVRTDPRSAKNSRRPLQRVATENATTQPSHRPPPLSRFPTDSVLIPTLKREGSEVPSLSSIPLKDTQSTSSRNSLSQFQRFTRREIDLDAMSKTNEAKIKKKAHIEQELKEAISTLKKPNRGEAVREYADSTDRRIQGGGGGSSSRPAGNNLARKPSNRVERKAAQQTVQVGATPKRSRKAKEAHPPVVQATPNYRLPAAWVQDQDPVPPPSSDPVIPSSAIRPAAPGSAAAPDTVLGSSAGSAAVEDTPSRGPAKMVSFFAGAPASRPPVSNLAAKLRMDRGAPPPAFRLPGAQGSRVLGTPPKARSAPRLGKGPAPVLETPVKGGLLETPVKGGLLETPVKGGPLETPARASGGEQKMEKEKVVGRGREGGGAEVDNEVSIFSALGWDDDVDELA